MALEASANGGMFSAIDVRRHMAELEAAKASEALRRAEMEEAKKKALIAEFHKPPDQPPEQIMELVKHLVSAAAERGDNHVQVYRFPSIICKDGGRSINSFDSNWPESLDGLPRAAYEFWRQHLQPLGYGLKAEILDYPGGMPGDVGLTLTW
jgi:hypothetical protein